MNLLFKDKNQMLRYNEEQVAVDLLVDLFVGFVLHVIRVFIRHAVDDDLLGQLDSQSVLVDGDLLDVVAASDLDTSLGD